MGGGWWVVVVVLMVGGSLRTHTLNLNLTLAVTLTLTLTLTLPLTPKVYLASYIMTGHLIAVGTATQAARWSEAKEALRATHRFVFLAVGGESSRVKSAASTVQLLSTRDNIFIYFFK